ncbi:MAG: hypothetical protein GXP25_06970 [Planctomycetes bacterium]|nr:hypothetical protein [Planctomycetota bacterium]
MKLPTTAIGGIEISRMICGSNPFFGFSHFTQARSTWQKRYFTVERIAEVLEKCTEFGINAVISGMMDKMHEAIQIVQDKTGGKIHWICTPGGALEECKKGVQWCAEHDVTFCLPHPSFTDAQLVRGENKIIGVEEITKMTRGLGMIPGVSTHRPETPGICDKAGYDVETYVQIINVLGFLCSVETPWQSSVIRNAKKPCICIKPLAAGRVTPHEGLPYVYSVIAPKDTVAVGFLCPEEVEEDVKIVMNVIGQAKEDIALESTRSKAHLK